MLVAVGLLLWRAQRALGGTTGDVLGAVEQLAEIAVLLAAASIAA
jgi:cobalamin synthase